MLSFLFKLLNLILYLDTMNSHLCYFLLNIVIFICFSTYFFDNITLCIKISNVTLSNMSYLVYITLSGETNDVTLSRLECTSIVEAIGSGYPYAMGTCAGRLAKANCAW